MKGVFTSRHLTGGWAGLAEKLARLPALGERAEGIRVVPGIDYRIFDEIKGTPQPGDYNVKCQKC